MAHKPLIKIAKVTQVGCFTLLICQNPIGDEVYSLGRWVGGGVYTIHREMGGGGGVYYTNAWLG